MKKKHPVKYKVGILKREKWGNVLPLAGFEPESSRVKTHLELSSKTKCNKAATLSTKVGSKVSKS